MCGEDHYNHQDGICGDQQSSTTDILGSLSEAITGYIPIVSMLGNQESLQDLERTIQALSKAKVSLMSAPPCSLRLFSRTTSTHWRARPGLASPGWTAMSPSARWPWRWIAWLTL